MAQLSRCRRSPQSLLLNQRASFASYDVHPDTVANITAWGKRLGLSKRMVDPTDMHVTTIYSRQQFPFQVLGRKPLRCEFIDFTLLGKEGKPGVMVAVLDSKFLHDLFDKRQTDGAQWDYPSYIPHLTIMKKVERAELRDMPRWDFPVMLTEEHYEPLDEDFSYNNKMESKAELIDVSAAQAASTNLCQP
jgi:hypothetical protein